MHRRHHYFLLFAGVLIAFTSSGQSSPETPAGEVSVADFQPSSPVIDSNVNVVILRDSGTADLESYFGRWLVRQTRYRRVLIRNKNGFDAAKVDISFDPDANIMGMGVLVSGRTCNLVEGKIVQTKLDSSEIFLDKESGDEYKYRISFPNISEGSIIEYSYSLFSRTLYTFHPWKFQGEYPRLKSTYRMTFPQAFNYVVIKQGILPMLREDLTKDTLYVVGRYTIRTKAYTIIWEMNDVPAFKEEPYISAPSDLVSGVRFQLSEYTNLETGRRQKVQSTWEEINKDLYKSKAFGGIMTTSSHWLRKEMRTIVADSVNGMDKARAAFAFVRDHFTSTGRSVIADEDQSLKDIFKSRKGSVAEINLILTAMLREEGLLADAVILGTRDHGQVSPTYPVADNFNYVIVRLRSGGRTYYLDASGPRLGFGQLPPECYNGYARVVSEKPDSVIMDADSLTEHRVSSIVLSNNEHGDSLTGEYSAVEGLFTSESVRDEVAVYGEQRFFELERKNYPFPVEVSDTHIDSLQLYDAPITVHYSIALPTGEEDRLYLNPMFNGGVKSNLFSAAERHYPVEMPFQMDFLYVLRMEVPKGYEVEEVPKSARVLLGSDGLYEYLIQADPEIVQVRSRLVVKRTYFAPEAYQPLRDFFAAVMKKQAEVVVFKKKK